MAAISEKKEFAAMDVIQAQAIHSFWPKYKYVVKDAEGRTTIFVKKPYRLDNFWAINDNDDYDGIDFYEDVIDGKLQEILPSISWEDPPIKILDIVHMAKVKKNTCANYSDPNSNASHTTYKCPVCHCVLHLDWHEQRNYCPECGVKLDWGQDDEK